MAKIVDVSVRNRVFRVIGKDSEGSFAQLVEVTVPPWCGARRILATKRLWVARQPKVVAVEIVEMAGL